MATKLRNVLTEKYINMKKFLNISLFIFAVSLLFTACKDDIPGPMDTSSQHTVLKSIKIINAGESGTDVVIGTVNEETKTVEFPRLDTLTDFSNLKFEVETSDGAKLEKESYAVDFAGESTKSLVVKVVNEPRFREYILRLRLLVPVYGADFDKAKVYDFGANGNPYPSFVSLNVRGTGFDGEHVLVIDRGSAGPHLLKVSDLKENKIERIPLNTTGASGGTFPYNMGAQINGHTYMASLSTSQTNPLKIYHWTDPSAAPEVVYDVLAQDFAGAGDRNGDNFSLSLDENGNGYAFFISMGVQVLRIKVENYTTFTDTKAFNVGSAYGQWAAYNRIGNSQQFLLTSNIKPISVVNNSGTVAYTMGNSAVPVRANDARVIDFNGERYLLIVTVARGAGEGSNVEVYDINKGEDVVEALSILDSNPRDPLFSQNLTGNSNAAPGAQTAFHIVKDADGNDEKLLIYGAHSDGGFVIAEFPVNVLEED